MTKLKMMLSAILIYFKCGKDYEKRYKLFHTLKPEELEIAVNTLNKAQEKIRNGRKKVVIWWLGTKVYRCSDGNYCITSIESEED
ncbi:MAG: hypothetical protein J6P07_00330 [Spirochaetaceae bacterium]|nr:hypothetical protein [Spirochaetaceae bacterium]MBO7731936.1 hypothetical protein [Methanobrevibacter sp.]